MMERQPRIKKKDRTGVWVSIAVHVGAIGAVVVVLLTTKVGQQILRTGLEAIREKKAAPPKQVQQRTTTTRTARKVSTDAPPPAGGGRRATDAPAAVGGESFFTETSEKRTGPAASGEGAKTNVALVVGPPPKPPTPLRIFSSAPAKSDIKQLLAERAKEAASVEAFGSEQISKSGVSDAGAIIKNVSGATVVDGKYAVVRGLSDRYVSTTFNGAEIPSADPYRRAASLDLFPAQVIDKVVVSKTFTPDQPGTTTGGSINIVSKSFPERAFANFSLGGGYNTQVTGNENFLTSSGGAFDWAGMDDGTRALPKDLAAASLRLPDAPFTSGSPSSSTYRQRIAAAQRLQAATLSLGRAEFAPRREAPPPAHNFSLAVGDTTHFLSRPFGVFASLSYRHDYSLYEDGISRRYETDPQSHTADQDNNYSDTRAVSTVNWAGIVNLAWQPHRLHELGFSFLYNQNTSDEARQQIGKDTDDPRPTFYRNRLIWTERNLQTFQLKGSHKLGEFTGLKLDWLGALSQTTQDEPDTRFFNYQQDGPDFTTGGGNLPDPRLPTRYFRALDENNRNEKIDLIVPFHQWQGNEGEFKLGLFDSFSERSYFDRELFYEGSDPFNGNPNDFLNRLGYTATTNGQRISWNWHRYLRSRDSDYTAESTVRAGYFLLDLPLWTPRRPLAIRGASLFESLRLVGGIRYETTDLQVNSRSYLANGITGRTANNSSISRKDPLPAAGLILSLRSNMNLRLHYSQTLARPSFRELAAYRSYDPLLDIILEGNPLLKMTDAENFDFRWEWFMRPGELLSLSFFRKSLKNAIEAKFITLDGKILSYDNRPNASVIGAELEIRKSLDFIHPDLRPFTLGGNFSLISSETKLLPRELQNKRGYLPDVKPTRSLYDQAPYIVNLDLSYDNPRLGTSASMLFNTAGPRIAIASLTTEDVYEQPAPALDFVFSQKLRRDLTLKLSARNLLNPRFERTYGKSGQLLYSSFRRGIGASMSLSYDF